MAHSWFCGWCGKGVSAEPHLGRAAGYAVICPNCMRFSIHDQATQSMSPPARRHDPVAHLPADVEVAWEEAVKAAGVGASTAAEIMCRKILMHVSVDVAASQPGKSFVQYIDDLDGAGYIPMGLKVKIDEIRTRGNVANHELPASTAADAERTLAVTRHLLVSVYELPNS